MSTEHEFLYNLMMFVPVVLFAGCVISYWLYNKEPNLKVKDD